MLLTLIALLVVTWPAPATTFHVAQNHPAAFDDNPGTTEAPWKTVSQAADAIVELTGRPSSS